MEMKEYLNFVKSRHNTYTQSKLLLKDCNDRNEYERLANDLLNDIFQDEKEHLNFKKDNNIIPVIEKEFQDLMNHAKDVLQFYNTFKQIKDF